MQALAAMERVIERIEGGVEKPAVKVEQLLIPPPPPREIRTRNFNLMSKGKLTRVENMLRAMGCGVIAHHKERKLTIFCLEPNAPLIANRPLVVTNSRDKLLLEQFGTGYHVEFTKGAYIGGRWPSALIWLRHYVETLIVNPRIMAQQAEGELAQPPVEVKAELDDVGVDPPAPTVVVVKDEPMEEEEGGGDEEGDSMVVNAGSDGEEGNAGMKEQLLKLEKRVKVLEEEKNWLMLGHADLKGKIQALELAMDVLHGKICEYN